MREIKFRAYLKSKNRIVSVFSIMPEIGLIEYLGGVLEKTKILRHFNEIELMQFTGLKDKNGKEIYEGDVVHFQDWDGDINHRNKPGFDDVDEGLGIVTFGHTVNWTDMPGVSYTHGWFLDVTENSADKYKTSGYFRGLGQASLEVIGNIYENPKLLK